MSAIQASDVLREWRESAPYWEKHGATIRAMFTPLTEALIQEAGIVEGLSVLDVAGGPGEPSLTIAETVGSKGFVMCTDAVAEMVLAAESEAARRGLKNINFRQCTAESLPFANSSFDAVISRLGAMFFASPPAALREMLRVTRPGGAVSLAVWYRKELNPFSFMVTDVISRHVEMPPADADAPGAFRFAEPGKLAGILREAGATEVRERLLKFRMEARISPEEFWEMRAEVSETLREKLATLKAEQLHEVAREVKQAVREFFPNDRMSFPAQMLIVTGKKPHRAAAS